MKQQMLQKQVDSLEKKVSKLEMSNRQQEYIISKLKEVLLLKSPEYQTKIDEIIKESKKVDNMSTTELHMFPWLELGE